MYAHGYGKDSIKSTFAKKIKNFIVEAFLSSLKETP